MTTDRPRPRLVWQGPPDGRVGWCLDYTGGGGVIFCSISGGWASDFTAGNSGGFDYSSLRAACNTMRQHFIAAGFDVDGVPAEITEVK